MTQVDRGTATDAWAVAVVESAAPDLLGYFLRRTRSDHDAADLLAEALLVIWRRRADVPRDAEAARMWCFGVARNTLRGHYRGGSRRIALADDLRAHLSVAAEEESDPARIAEQRESDSRVRAAVERLDRRSRELVALIHWDGFSITDAATLLGMNPSSARTRYARARARLARELGLDAAKNR